MYTYSNYPKWQRRVFLFVDKFNLFGFTTEIKENELFINYKSLFNDFDKHKKYWLEEENLEDITESGISVIHLNNIACSVMSSMFIGSESFQLATLEYLEEKRRIAEMLYQEELSRLEKEQEEERLAKEKRKLEREAKRQEEEKRKLEREARIREAEKLELERKRLEKIQRYSGIYYTESQDNFTGPYMIHPRINKNKFIGGIEPTPKSFKETVKYHDTVRTFHDNGSYKDIKYSSRSEDNLNYLHKILKEFGY